MSLTNEVNQGEVMSNSLSEAQTSDALVFQFYYKNEAKLVRRSSFSIDPVLFGMFVRRMGDPGEAKTQLRRWAKNAAEVGKYVDGVSVSRRVHRRIYELLDTDS